MNKPIQNMNSGPCKVCGTTDTVELAQAPTPPEKRDATVRWCSAGHVTVFNRESWSHVHTF